MAYLNPQFFSGPRVEKERYLAVDGHTWQAGQFGRFTDSGVVPCKVLATSIQLMFSQTQATATSSSTVYIERIESSSTRFIMAVNRSSSGTDTRAAATMIGGNYGLGVVDCVCVVAKSADTAANEGLRVHNLMSNLDGQSYATTDVPGYVLVSIVESFRTAEGSGV